MTFYTALSGLNAAQTDIAVTSNNIANVGTLGFHGSRAEFADIYTTTPYSRPESQVGAGTSVSRIGVDFTQGSLTATGNVLDLSIQGAGFFQVQTAPEDGALQAYTRSGAFNLTSDGYITNAAGQFLTGFPTAENGDALSTLETQPLQIPPQYGTAQATSTVDMSVRLSLSDNGGQGTQTSIPAAVFDPQDSTTYAFASAIPVLDDTGQAVTAQAYFVMTDAPDAADASLSYTVQLVVDGQVAAQPAPQPQLSFDASGAQTGWLADVAFTLNGAPFSLNLSGSTVSQDDFQVTSVSHDGQRRQDLAAIEIADDGTVWANYGGDDAIAVGRVAIASFTDLQSLTSIGNASYLASRDSGPARLGVAGSNGFGALQSGSIERSNVDLTEELVNLIMAQRNYQASAKALETNGKLSETVMNIRG